MNILFVCSGNICRSPMVEGLLQRFLRDKELHNDISVCSAGTLGIVDSLASDHSITACETEYQTDISNHRSQAISEELLQQADLVLCMAKRHVDDIGYEFPDQQYKCHLLKAFAGITNSYIDIADPIGQDLNEYVKTCHEISGLLQQSMDKIGHPSIYAKSSEQFEACRFALKP